jgi:hypothetical protein
MNTVFIIGAGASSEIGMPVGNELKKTIAKFLNQETRPSENSYRDAIDGAVSLHSKERLKTWKEDIRLSTVANKISKALPLAESIDNYLNAHKGNKDVEFIGKIGIIFSILHAEAHSKLKKTSAKLFNDIEKTWYAALFKKIAQGCQIDLFIQKMREIVFITFNYDRSLEYFFYNATQTYFDITSDQAKSITNEMRIFHPYGQAAFLPFQSETDSIEFGKLPNAEQLYNLSKQIKTFMEGVDESSKVYKKIIKSLEDANRIIYFGFAYYKQNMDLLYPQKIPGSKRINGTSTFQGGVKCYGTAFGFSENELATISENIQQRDARISTQDIELYQGECYDFLSKEYIQRITF